MNRNTQERFALNPVNIDIQRSRFLMTPEVKTSFNVSELVPLGMPIEVLPGDTFDISEAMAIRMQPLVSAPFDNLSFDIYYFFVPNRLVWNHWKEFMGENSDSPWIPQTQYTVPYIRVIGGARPGTILDYMGIPIQGQIASTDSIDINVLPLRGFALIYNEWFRNQNIQPPVMVHLDDTNRNYDSNIDNAQFVVSCEYGGQLPKVNKRPDYFTKGLPGPQKGPDLTIMDHMPVYFDAVRDNATVLAEHSARGSSVSYLNNSTPARANISAIHYGTSSIDFHNDNFQPNNWYVDGNLSISALRTAFQIQKLYERDARGGTRYREMLKAHFGVTSPDASQQVPQYLGGRTIPININSVIQTSETGSTPQGNVAGYSITASGSNNHSFIQSFTEHGYLFAVGCARIDQHTYQNGLHRSWSRRNRTDYYFPVLANISEQPILNKEIYAKGYTNSPDEVGNTDNEVFAYQEAWAEYRYFNSLVTSEMRSNVNNSLDSWHFADDYNRLPHLDPAWIVEDKANIDRVLAVQSSVSNQLFGDFRFNIKATRPMPMYSIPGFIDHN